MTGTIDSRRQERTAVAIDRAAAGHGRARWHKPVQTDAADVVSLSIAESRNMYAPGLDGAFCGR